MEEKIFGYSKIDWERWQTEHKEWQDSLIGLDMIPLWPHGTPGYKKEYGQEEPKLYLLPKQNTKRGTVLVCAGGGYHMKSVYEGRMVAEKYHDYGFNAAVLDYRCRPYSLQSALEDGQRAVRMLRYYSDEWNILPNHIAAGGFSAGGNLSSVLATQSENASKPVGDKIDMVSCQTDAEIQCYGAINYQGIKMISEEPENEILIKEFCPYMNVSSNTPPFFMWMTGHDEIISRKDFYIMAEALEEKKIPYELHLFPEGIHGVALADGSSKFGKRNMHTANWMRLSCEWLESLGF
jgi:acetyl esterase/lipase